MHTPHLTTFLAAIAVIIGLAALLLWALRARRSPRALVALSPDDPHAGLRVITIDANKDKEAIQSVARAMKNKERFIIVTPDEHFNPLGYDRHSAHVWIGAAGGGTLMTIGAGALVLAFFDPEPTSKLTALVAGGVIITLAGGAVLITILVTRSGYTSAMHFNHKRKVYEWTLSPNQ
jgi:hypothetical protein